MFCCKSNGVSVSCLCSRWGVCILWVSGADSRASLYLCLTGVTGGVQRDWGMVWGQVGWLLRLVWGDQVTRQTGTEGWLEGPVLLRLALGDPVPCSPWTGYGPGHGSWGCLDSP